MRTAAETSPMNVQDTKPKASIIESIWPIYTRIKHGKAFNIKPGSGV